MSSLELLQESEEEVKLTTRRISFGIVRSSRAAATFDLEKLIDTRLLIQANSGGGKSFLIRKMLEVTHGKVQQIVLDLEGEFGTLREKYDYILAGKEGDIPADPRTAETLARKILELGASIIIDLYELKQHERKHFVKLFLDTMINAPKDLWHPCVVVVDEAHLLCPEKEESEASDSVKDLMTRGRKRGYCGWLASQRLSKLNKDAAAEANNVLIGRTGLDVDMKRASEILGFTSKEQMLSLRDLEPGNFFAFGPALSKSVEQIEVGMVQTTHPKAGARIQTRAPPPQEKVKSVLAKLADLPQVAQKELKEREDFVKEIRELKMKLRVVESSKNQISPEQIMEIRDRAFAEGQRTVQQQTAKQLREFEITNTTLKKALQKISAEAARSAGVEVPKVEIPKMPTIAPIVTMVRPAPKPVIPQTLESSDVQPLRAGAMKMLKAAAQFYPRDVTLNQVATLAGFSVTGGTFGTYRSEIRRNGWWVESGDRIQLTEEGLKAAGPVDPLPTDPQLLIDMWASKFREGAAKMLRVIAARYPGSISKEEVGAEISMAPDGGTFGTYLGELRRNLLVKVEGDQITASSALFLEDN